MTPAIMTKLSPQVQRALAFAIFIALLALALAILLGPVLLLHRHYDVAIAETSDRIDRLRRVAAQAPELRHALDAMKERDGRRFFLKNTAVRDDGRFKQIGVNVQFFATTPALQKLLNAIESQQPYLLVDNITVRPLNAFRGFKPAPGMEPEVNVQLDVSAFAYADPVKPAAPAASGAAGKS